ncbi:MAG: Holliday junction resolvase RuvX [Leptospirillia bacterium]
MTLSDTRIMALDVGDATIGVAVSDLLRIAAHPVETILRKRPGAEFDRIRELIAEQNVERILVGLPRMLDGSLGVQAEKVEAFVADLEDAIDTPVILWDERFSTVAAEKALIESGMTRKKRKKVVDQVAAVYFLQGYLEHLRMTGDERG